MVNIEKTKKAHHESMEKGFLIIQKELLFTDLTILEILVYSYLKDKIELSKSNSDFYDLNELKYYCVVSNQELMDFIQCGKTKIIQIKNNLEKIGLIKQVRQMDKSNKIFVNDYKIQ